MSKITLKEDKNFSITVLWSRRHVSHQRRKEASVNNSFHEWWQALSGDIFADFVLVCSVRIHSENPICCRLEKPWNFAFVSGSSRNVLGSSMDQEWLQNWEGLAAHQFILLKLIVMVTYTRLSFFPCSVTDDSTEPATFDPWDKILAEKTWTWATVRSKNKNKHPCYNGLTEDSMLWAHLKTSFIVHTTSNYRKNSPHTQDVKAWQGPHVLFRK